MMRLHHRHHLGRPWIVRPPQSATRDPDCCNTEWTQSCANLVGLECSPVCAAILGLAWVGIESPSRRVPLRVLGCAAERRNPVRGKP